MPIRTIKRIGLSVMSARASEKYDESSSVIEIISLR
jgi:hypothetical protein